MVISKSGLTRCSKCRKFSSDSCFHKNSFRHNGLASECKDCVRSRMKSIYIKKYIRKDAKVYREAMPRLNSTIRKSSKRCPTFLRIKSIAEFYNNYSRHDGKSWQCKDCENIRKRKYRSFKVNLSISEQRFIRKQFRRSISSEARQNDSLDTIVNGTVLKDLSLKLPDDSKREDIMDKPGKIITNLIKSV